MRRSTSASVVPSRSRTAATVIASGQAVASWSSDDTASRKLPPAARAIVVTAAGSISIDSSRAIRCSTVEISGRPGRANANRWQRLRIVGSIAAISVVQRTNTACEGGSSSVFSTAFEASFVSMWASSMMYTLRRPRTGWSATRSRISRMSSMPRWLAASSSITSIDVASWMLRHDSHSLHGVVVGPCSQFSALARIFAIDVLPVPRGPAKR